MYRSPEPALEPLTVEHLKGCAFHEDASGLDCMNCGAVATDADQCADCGINAHDWGGNWRGPAGCICDDIDEGLQADEAERREP